MIKQFRMPVYKPIVYVEEPDLKPSMISYIDIEFDYDRRIFRVICRWCNRAYLYANKEQIPYECPRCGKSLVKEM